MFFFENFFFKNLNIVKFFVKIKIKFLYGYFFKLNFNKKDDFFNCSDSYFLENVVFFKKFYNVCNNFSRYFFFNNKNLFNKFFFFNKNYNFFFKLNNKKYNFSNKLLNKNIIGGDILVSIKPDLVSKDIFDKNYFNSFFFLRKTKIFNKGRYSRNRQLYKTGVYFCLYINILAIYAIYFLFYRFTFNFGYFWIFMFFCVFSFFFSRFFKYNFFSRIKLDLYIYFNWVSIIFYNIYLLVYSIFLKIYNFFRILV